MAFAEPEIILPAAAPRCRFAERVQAARAAGLSRMGLAMWQYNAERRSGRSDADLLADLERAGVGVAEVEVLYGGLLPDEDGQTAAFAERLFALASTFGAKRVICGGNRDEDLDESARRFAGMCDRAAGHGLTLALEFVPWSSDPDLRTAWEIVRRSDRPNSGLVLDTWHFFRGDPDLSVIAAVPPEKFALIQFDDGPEPMAGLEPFEETTRFRKFPGEGTFDLVGLVRALDEHGVRAPIAPEIISDELEAMEPAAAARHMVETTRAVFREARAG